MRRSAKILAAVVVFGGSFWLYHGPAGAKYQQWKYNKAHQKEIALINEAKSRVRMGLKDPYSARWGFISAYTDTTNGKTFVCGEVNSKNGFGAYGGMQRWVYHTDSLGIPEYDFTTIFDSVEQQFCFRGELDSLHHHTHFIVRPDTI